jgi:hypothetical protein
MTSPQLMPPGAKLSKESLQHASLQKEPSHCAIQRYLGDQQLLASFYVAEGARTRASWLQGDQNGNHTTSSTEHHTCGDKNATGPLPTSPLLTARVPSSLSKQRAAIQPEKSKTGTLTTLSASPLDMPVTVAATTKRRPQNTSLTTRQGPENQSMLDLAATEAERELNASKCPGRVAFPDGTYNLVVLQGSKSDAIANAPNVAF